MLSTNHHRHRHHHRHWHWHRHPFPTSIIPVDPSSGSIVHSRHGELDSDAVLGVPLDGSRGFRRPFENWRKKFRQRRRKGNDPRVRRRESATAPWSASSTDRIRATRTWSSTFRGWSRNRKPPLDRNAPSRRRISAMQLTTGSRPGRKDWSRTRRRNGMPRGIRIEFDGVRGDVSRYDAGRRGPVQNDFFWGWKRIRIDSKRTWTRTCRSTRRGRNQRTSRSWKYTILLDGTVRCVPDKILGTNDELHFRRRIAFLFAASHRWGSNENAGTGIIVERHDHSLFVVVNANPYLIGTESAPGGPVVGAIISVTEDLKIASEAVAKGKILRENAEALQFLSDSQRDAFAPRRQRKPARPSSRLGGTLPGIETVKEPTDADVQIALSAMSIQDNGTTNLNYFIQAYRAVDFPFYAD